VVYCIVQAPLADAGYPNCLIKTTESWVELKESERN